MYSKATVSTNIPLQAAIISSMVYCNNLLTCPLVYSPYSILSVTNPQWLAITLRIKPQVLATVCKDSRNVHPPPPLWIHSPTSRLCSKHRKLFLIPQTLHTCSFHRTFAFEVPSMCKSPPLDNCMTYFLTSFRFLFKCLFSRKNLLEHHIPK